MIETIDALLQTYGTLVGLLLAVLFLLMLSLLFLQHVRQRKLLATALTHIQQQQLLLQQQQKFLQDQHQRFEPTLQQHIKQLAGQFQTGLLHTQQEVMNLSKALRTTHQQGSWGELQLLTCLTLAGMQEHADFEAQQSFPSLDRRQRPDVLVSIPPDRHIAIDAKAPLETYLTAQKRVEETGENKHVGISIKAMRRHINELAEKEYWRQGNAPEFVILFLPTESMFRVALEHDPALIEYGLQRKVMLASPISLLTLLKVIAYGWSVESRGQNVEHILKYQQQIYHQLAQAHQHWNTLRNQLDDAVKTFNKIMTTYAETVAPSLEALRQMDTTMKTSSSPLVPITLLQRRLEPIVTIPEELLDGEEEPREMIFLSRTMKGSHERECT